MRHPSPQPRLASSRNTTTTTSRFIGVGLVSMMRTRKRTRRRPLRLTTTNAALLLLLLCTAILSSLCGMVSAFAPSLTTTTTTTRSPPFQRQTATTTAPPTPSSFARVALARKSQSAPFAAASSSPTALAVWWFGGSPEEEVTTATDDADSCELVAVRIERTSPNSRRIFGEIVAETALQDVWTILTDYNRLATHVPNLVESRVTRVATPNDRPGSGTYRCRLFQKGAQKIVGFEFGASVTMDMVESILAPAASSSPSRKIGFTCADSFFFSEFDGEWLATEQQNPVTGATETLLSYTVDVRPKGPVPVAALEWRIREDVPTNLRAVKAAALLRSANVNDYGAVTAPNGVSANGGATTTTADMNGASSPSISSRSRKTTAAATSSPDTTLTAYVEDATQNTSTTTSTTSKKNGTAASVPATIASLSWNTMTPRQRQDALKAKTAQRVAQRNTANYGGTTPQQQQQPPQGQARRKPLTQKLPRTPYGGISEAARAATPPPRRKQSRKKVSSSSSSQQTSPATALSKFKVDWDDNETLGAYLNK